MTEPAPEPRCEDLVFEYELDAAPEKVWRAISQKAFRERWLPARDLADEEPVSTTPGREVSYRMRESAPPYLESLVTFEIAPNPAGGARLTIIHELADPRRTDAPSAANDNAPALMRAA